jgi:hypothetical protein
MHKMGGPVAIVLPPKLPPPVARDWEQWHAQALVKTSQEALQRLGGVLGVSAGSLSRLGAAWFAGGPAWSFPMRNGAGEIIGIRLRSEDGSKYAVTGSQPRGQLTAPPPSTLVSGLWAAQPAGAWRSRLPKSASAGT